MKEKCHIEKGKENNYVFVFSCPGQVEQKENKPAAGQTGENLEGVLNYLQKKGYKGFDRENNLITITNVWDKVEYIAETNRREATISEIMHKDNINRLVAEIKDKKNIICCGKKAKTVIDNISDKLGNSKIIYTCHLSNLAINRIYKSGKETAMERRKDRCIQVAKEIIKQLK